MMKTYDIIAHLIKPVCHRLHPVFILHEKDTLIISSELEILLSLVYKTCTVEDCTNIYVNINVIGQSLHEYRARDLM